MSEIGWIPVLILAGGAIFGILAALRLSRGTGSEGQPDPGNLALRLTDLEAEKEQLFRKLRGEDGEVPQGADRQTLQRRAARVLRDLDSLGSRPHPSRAAPGLTSPTNDSSAGSPTAPTTVGWIDRHQLLAGALLGAGMVGLVAVLVLWAQQDARPTDPQPTPAQRPNNAAAGEVDRGEAPLPPEIARQVASLRQRLEGEPDDLELRRELVRLLLGHGQFFDSFGEARALLERAPEDALATYTIGVVRYTMGQSEDALIWLDRSIAADPSFSQASLIRGILLLQMGERERAIESWQKGLDAVGGSEPTLERLLADARAGKSNEEILQAPG